MHAMTTPRLKLLRNKPRFHQRGAAVLILMLIVMLGLITLFSFRMDRKEPELNADRKTALALALAKEALLGWAATDGANTSNINPGRLPCPDQTNSGNSPGAVCPSNLGHLPWKTLRVDDLRDGAAERLWYIVDQSFRSSSAWINSITQPTLTLNGKPVVAIIFSPGAALQSQTRAYTGAASTNAANYLENYTIPTIVTQPPSAAYNDRVIAITAADVFTIVTRRMTQEFAQGIGAPPYPSTPPTLPSTSTWDLNGWGSAITSYNASDTSGGTNYNMIKLTYANCTGQPFTILWNATTYTNDVTWTGTC